MGCKFKKEKADQNCVNNHIKHIWVSREVLQTFWLLFLATFAVMKRDDIKYSLFNIETCTIKMNMDGFECLLCNTQPLHLVKNTK